MKLDIVSLADSVFSSASPAAAWAAFSVELARAGLDRAFLQLDLPGAAANPFAGHPGSRTFGLFWDEALDAELRAYAGDIRQATRPELLHIRPTLRYLSRFRSPFYLSHRGVLERSRSGPFVPICRIMLEEMGQHHVLVMPLADPVHGALSALTLWLDEPRPDFPDFVSEWASGLQMAGLYFRTMLDQRWPAKRVAVDPGGGTSLSTRERQVLAALAAGALVTAIADQFAITERSVQQYIARAKLKLGARSRTEAVVIALKSGQI